MTDLGSSFEEIRLTAHWVEGWEISHHTSNLARHPDQPSHSLLAVYRTCCLLMLKLSFVKRVDLTGE